MDLLQNGRRGGAEFADLLRMEVASLLRYNPEATHWNVMIAFYLDVNTMFAKCVSADLPVSTEGLREFVCGFTQAHPLFDLVDVGQDKEKKLLKINSWSNPGTSILQVRADFTLR